METLSEILNRLGYSYGMPKRSSTGRNTIFRAETYMGEFTAQEAWDMLRDLHADQFKNEVNRV